MTREAIKNFMLHKINNCLEEELRTNIEDYIDEEIVEEYLWNKDYGINLIHDYIENNADDIIEEYLDDIYDEIEYSDLDC